MHSYNVWYIYNHNIKIEFNFDGIDLKAESQDTHIGHIIEPNVCSDVIQDASYSLIHGVKYVLNNFIYCSHNVRN